MDKQEEQQQEKQQQEIWKNQEQENARQMEEYKKECDILFNKMIKHMKLGITAYKLLMIFMTIYTIVSIYLFWKINELGMVAMLIVIFAFTMYSGYTKISLTRVQLVEYNALYGNKKEEKESEKK